MGTAICGKIQRFPQKECVTANIGDRPWKVAGFAVTGKGTDVLLESPKKKEPPRIMPYGSLKARITPEARTALERLMISD